MKVFKSEPQGPFTGGVLLIAANTAEEASKFLGGDPLEEGRYYDAYIETSYPIEVEGMSFETNTPQIIMSRLYSE